MIDYGTTQLQQTRRRAYLLGQRSVLFPKTRTAILEQARRALGLLSARDQHALIAETAIDGGEEEMTRRISMLVGTIFVIARRMTPLSQISLARLLMLEAERLITSDDQETRH